MSFRLVRSSLAFVFISSGAACGTPLSFTEGSGGAPPNSGGAIGAGGAAGGNASGGAISTGGSVGGSLASGGASAGGSPSGGSRSEVGGAPSGGQSGDGGTLSGGSGTGGASSGGQMGNAGGGGNADPCPTDNTFCSGFEDANLPTGAVFKLNGNPSTPWTQYFTVDSAEKKSGSSSLRVKSATEVSDAYKMLSVPTGGANFWVRLYMRSDKDLGVNDHNVFGQASGSDEPNDGTSVEFAEDVGIAFNSQDSVRWPIGYGRLMDGGTMPFTLPKDTWHCIELHFDGTARIQDLYINGEQKINATDYPAATKAFTRFKFGYNSLHNTSRVIWYDDVAVGPTRPGCLP